VRTPYMNPISKAVIPVAGFGTRMLPAAKAVPKELLPILDRPTIQYVVEEAAAGGITNLLLVTSRDKRAIEDHFDRSPELEARLKSAGKENLLDSLNQLIAKIRVHAIRQAAQLGLGDAVNQARAFVGDEPFLCMLGDTIFSGSPGPAEQLLAAARELGSAVIGLEEVPEEKVERYGIVGGKEIKPGVIRIDKLVEKPSRQSTPSRLAVAARYVLTPAIFDCLDATPPGKGGEIQLTDALQLLLNRQPVHGVLLSGRRHDIGNPLDWLKTNLLFARQDQRLWKELEPTLRTLLP
jgi:UTP--glucose-1-phosphate uridylyltransferase